MLLRVDVGNSKLKFLAPNSVETVAIILLQKDGDGWVVRSLYPFVPGILSSIPPSDVSYNVLRENWPVPYNPRQREEERSGWRCILLRDSFTFFWSIEFSSQLWGCYSLIMFSFHEARTFLLTTSFRIVQGPQRIPVDSTRRGGVTDPDSQH